MKLYRFRLLRFIRVQENSQLRFLKSIDMGDPTQGWLQQPHPLQQDANQKDISLQRNRFRNTREGT